MYMFRIDHVTYDRTRDGQPLTLADALAAVYGTRGAAVLRLDGTEVISNAGSAYAVTYTPTGRTITRRGARHLRYSPACRMTGQHDGCDGWTYGARGVGICQCHTCGCSRRRTPGSARVVLCR